MGIDNVCSTINDYHQSILEDYYQSILDNISGGVQIAQILYNDQGVPIDYLFLEVNSIFAEIMGLAKEEIVGNKVTDFFPDCEPEWFIKYGEIVKTGKSETFEMFNVSTCRWFRVLAVPLGDQDRLAIMGTDITERKEIEEELRKSKERQAFQLKLSDMLRPLSDAKEIKRTAAQVVGEHLGVDQALYNEITDNSSTIHIEDSYVRCGTRKIIGDFSVSNFGAAMDVLLRGEPLIIEDQTTTPLKPSPEKEASIGLGVFASMTVPLVKEGRWVANFGVLQSSPRRWTDHDLAVLKDAAERTWEAVERAKAEQALRASEEKFRGFIETAGEGIVENDADGRIVFVNQQMARMLGYTQKEILGQISLDYVVENQVEQARADREKLIAGNNIACETKLRHKDGSPVWVLCKGTPLYDANGQYQGSLVMHVDISERKQMEEDKQLLLNAVRMERDCLSALINNIPDEIWFADSSGNMTMTNQSVQEQFGASFLGINIAEVLASLEIYRSDGSHRPMDECFIFRALKGEKIVNLVEIIRTPVDNELKYRQINAAPVRDVNGNIIGAVGIARDITEQKQAEKEFAMSRLDKLSTLYVNNGDLAAILDEILELAIDFTGADMGNIQLLDAETGLLRMMAHRGFEQPFLDFWAVVDQEAGSCGTAMRRGERVIVEDVTRSPIFVGTPALDVQLEAGVRACQSTPLINRAGEFVGMLSTHFRSPHVPDKQDLQLVGLLAQQAADLLERKKSEDALRRSEEHFSVIFNNSPEVIIIVDMETDRLVDVNRRFTEILGYCREEVIGRTLEELNYFTDLHLYDETHENDTLTFNEAVLQSKSGRLINVLFSDAVAEIGRRNQRIIICKDITDQKIVEAEMARLDRLNLIGEMAASIGHEVRNPMTTVKGFLQFLREKEIYAGDRRYFDLMIDELDRANFIISEFLSLANNKRVELEKTDINKLLESLLPLIQAEGHLTDKSVKLDTVKVPDVLLDKKELRQMVLNLVRNGLDSMSSGGTLTIGTVKEADQVIMFVKDEGTGLPPEIIDKLGTPFVTTKENGTGLGLAVCYSIAARHNARINFETGPEGTTFSVHFPVEY